jgi:hypothetical protein
MNAQERLHAAHLGTLEGKYEEALSEYIWFHDHALAEQPSLYGVRLSFALSYWKELAEVYPPALVALREVRDNKVRRLNAGELDRELFHDAEAINQYLGASSDTARLFESLDNNHPEFAKACGNLALEALVEAGRFHLAAKYIPDPIGQVTKLAERLNHDIARIPERPRSKAPRYRAHTWSFALDLRTIVAVLSGADQQAEADKCRAKAFAVLKPWYVRKAVERALASEA